MEATGATMTGGKKRVPAIDGWFETETAAPHLLGSRCTSCGSYFFPKEAFYCRNPRCQGTAFDEVPLSRTGTLWSFTSNCYKPPEPYVSPEPFRPYVIAAVELAAEKMVVLGQVVSGVEVGQLRAGMTMELVVETLYEDDEHDYVVWKWTPVVG
jgi:uncharacterized OB-fold protein